MKRTIVCILLAGFISAGIFSQEKEVRDGYTKIYYPSGKVSSEGTMRNGQPDGYWKTYFISGILKSEGNRRNHLLDSIWVFYNEAGDTMQKVNYVVGKRNGFIVEYNVGNSGDPMAKGRIISKELYVNDKKEGKSFYYFSDGSIKEEVYYVLSKRNGSAVEYDVKGNIITIQRYKNGMLIEREKINRIDEKGLKQGIWKRFYSNGRVKSEIYYRDDIYNGLYKEYDEEGNVKNIFQYTEGRLIENADTAEFDIEVRNEYDKDGNVIYNGTYRKNIPVGIHRQLDGKGKVVNGFLYADTGIKLGEGIITQEGKKEGAWKYYYENGSLKAGGNYSNNNQAGTWKFYGINGEIEQTGVYKNGKFDGLWSWYYPSGSIKCEEEYFEGKEEGNYVEYDSIGGIISKGSYFDGLKEGEWYYKAGDYSEKGSYVGDLKDGEWLSFYENDNVRYKGNYVQGNPDGEHLYYYENGIVREISYYVNGISERNWKKFDENGLLLITITYKDNREYRINGEKLEFNENDIKLIQ